MTALTVTIFGSCISRDVFNYIDKNIMVVKTNIQRNAIKSIWSEALPQNLVNDAPGNSSWANRMLRISCLKHLTEVIRTAPTDYIMLDLYEERLPIYQLTIENKTILLPKYGGTEWLVGQLKYNDAKVLNGWDFSDDFLTENVKKTIDYLLQFYKQEQIIINEAYLLKEYIEDNLNICPMPNQSYIDRINLHLEKMYDLVKSFLPNAHIIKMPKNTLAEKYHIWGLANVHAERSFYEYVAESVGVIAGFNKTNSQEGLYLCRDRENSIRKELLLLLAQNRSAK